MSVPDTQEFEVSQVPPRSEVRRFFASIVIVSATALALGLTLKTPTQLEANDISRWCTVWSLVERGTYAIDACPWQTRTQDKVFKGDPFQKLGKEQKPAEANVQNPRAPSLQIFRNEYKAKNPA